MSAKSSRVDRRAHAQEARPRRARARGRAAGAGAGSTGLAPDGEDARSGRSRRRSRRAPSSRPKTARRMTSSVSACRRGCSATGSSRGQRSTSARGDLGHHLRQPRDLLAVEGGQHEPALGEVGVLVEQDHRVAADRRGSRMRAPLPGCRTSARRREDLLDLLGVGEHHERRRAEQADREAPAVARAAALEEGHRPRPPAHRLQPARGARSRRQRRGGHGGTLPLPNPGTPVTGVPTSLASPDRDVLQ